MAGGAGVYLVFFDSLSEEELVTITPFWAFPISFGFYGYVSQRLIRYLDEGRASSMYEAAGAGQTAQPLGSQRSEDGSPERPYGHSNMDLRLCHLAGRRAYGL